MTGSVRRPRGPTDRDRPARIAQATIEVLKAEGLAGLTHRAVARQADVPLGSTTYHFSGRHDLLAAAIRQAIDESVEELAVWADGLDRSNVAARLALLLEKVSTPGDPRNRLLVEYELYLAAARDLRLRPLSHEWDSVLRDILVEKVGPIAGRMYFVAYNGLVLESLITETPLDHVEMEALLTTVSLA